MSKMYNVAVKAVLKKKKIVEKSMLNQNALRFSLYCMTDFLKETWKYVEFN